ncbi:MAG TPA: hypothetical protein VGX68_28425 [Thermoanaerobaculia bacterium]|nr:hypothetical protein [Thermoanaerobaculia bacterium]
MTSISLRPTREEDLPGLVAFLTERFGRAWTPEEWRWKYRSLPGGSRSWVAVEAGGAIAAHAGALRLPARWRRGETGIWQLVDFAGTVRKRGLRPALVELGILMLEDLPGKGDAPWIFGFPSERHFRLGERSFGYHPLVELEELGGSIPEEPAPKGTHIETGDSCGDWAEAVWEACEVAGVRRSAAFLNWRYHARPHRYYRFYRLASGGAEGLAVFAFVGEEAWAAELWLPPVGEWYPSLLAVAADLRASGLTRWRFWPPPAGLRIDGLLASLGLRPTGERRFIGCRGRAGGADPAAMAEGFVYAMGDYDLV